MPTHLSRREFLGCLGTTAALWYWYGLPAGEALAQSPQGFFDKWGPIDRSLDDTAPRVFYGDDFERAHKALWDIPAYLATQKPPVQWEETELAVIGGGLSGLFTAYAFADKKPVVLEQAARFGGNAKGFSWRGTDVALGSAYFPLPAPDDPFRRFYDDLGLDKLVQKAPEGAPVGLDGKTVLGFWEGAADPKNQAAYTKLFSFIESVHNGKQGPYPAIPTADAKTLNRLKELDAFSLYDALVQTLGPLPPKLAAALDAYCWSAFAASSIEVSAAAGLNFLAAEVNPVCVAPGGNAGVAEKLLKGLLSKGVPASQLRSSSLALKVTPRKDSVDIQYEAADGTLKGLRARAVVLACPKYVAARILDGIEPERKKAIESIEYRSYLSAAVLIGKPLKRNFYDLFLVDSKATPGDIPKGATDVSVGTLGQTRGRHTALTLYRAVPGKGARAALSAPDAFAKAETDFNRQIEQELLPMLGFSKSEIVDTRIARWGHALPVPKTGVFTSDLPQALRKPHGTRVFFVEQDNWLTPALETGVGDLVLQEPLIRAVLGKNS